MNAPAKAVQLLFPGYKFGIDDADEALMLAELGVGGFCLFGGLPEEVAAFCARLQKAAPRPLLLCADFEDGVATQVTGATPLPSNMGLGAANSETLAFEKGEITAIEARALGVSWVLAPVCDLATAPANPIVNTRAFSADPGDAARLARAFLRGLKSRGVLGCLKHFPGHGETTEDSHLQLPRLDLSREKLRERELVPFAALAAEADAVMTGHLVVPALSGEEPYSISADVAKTLRGELGFAGLVSTDALMMQAIAANYDELEACRRALLGGSDILLMPRDPRGLARDLAAEVEKEGALAAAVEAAWARLEKARAAAAAGPAASPLEVVGSAAHAERAQKLAEACLAWAGPALPPLPKAVAYWEAEASGEDEWQGAAFVEELRALGREVTPWTEAARPEAVVAGAFLSPRAYTGRIAYEEEELSRLKAVLASGARGLVASFGSPFVFPAAAATGLCAFASSVPAQRAAARALTGGLSVNGRMPVLL